MDMKKNHHVKGAIFRCALSLSLSHSLSLSEREQRKIMSASSLIIIKDKLILYLSLSGQTQQQFSDAGLMQPVWAPDISIPLLKKAYLYLIPTAASLKKRNGHYVSRWARKCNLSSTLAISGLVLEEICKHCTIRLWADWLHRSTLAAVMLLRRQYNQSGSHFPSIPFYWRICLVNVTGKPV